jgi:hypothetical protein
MHTFFILVVSACDYCECDTFSTANRSADRIAPIVSYNQFYVLKWKSIRPQKLGSIVDQGCLIAEKTAEFCQRSSDMSGTANDQMPRRF